MFYCLIHFTTLPDDMRPTIPALLVPIDQPCVAFVCVCVYVWAFAPQAVGPEAGDGPERITAL